MWFGKRAPRSGSAGRRGAERPRVEGLEDRLLLAIDLGGVTPPSTPVSTSPLPNIATVPFGIDMAGGNSNGGAGFSVTDVGDVNGDGFDDFVVGSPTVVNSGGQIALGTGRDPTAYLIFGSNQVNTGTINWLLNNAQNRVGDLVQLGNSPGVQTNPINGQTGFAFNGIKFITSQETQSQLGASVAALGAIHGQNAFILGAPGGTVNGSNTVQAGRAFLIYGGTNLNSLSGATIDLDNMVTNQGLTFIAFVTNATGAQLGFAVAGPGDVFGDQTNDVAIGAPDATYNGQPNAGVAILIDGGALPTVTSTVLVDGVGQAGGTRGVIFGGPNASDRVGAALAGAGDFNGVISGGNTRIDDLLIGAPDIATTYLVYGGAGLPALATPVPAAGGLNSINLSRLGASGTAANTVLGATIVGEPGDGTGFALSTAGDFNADGNDDFLIGSPFFNGNEGRVTLFYGQNVATNGLFGTILLDTIPNNDPAIQYLGASAGSLAGYAVSDVGRINLLQAPNPILIGSPGFAGNSGAAYLIPGNVSTPVGSFNLTNAESQPIAATQLTFTTPGGSSTPFFGASVSGRLTISGQRVTADADLLGDFIIGAPGYGAIGGRALDGGAMIVEGALIPVQTPISTSITTTISVDAPESVAPPYPVNALTPNTIQIFVESVKSANFDPVRDINPATIVVNGVAFTAAQVSIAKDPVDENNDGIEDAIITLTPRSALNLNPSVTTLTITGRTLASSPIPNKTFTGSTTITVTGGGGGGGGGAAGVVPIGLVLPSFFQPPFGPEQFVPAPSALSALNYKPIPKRVAYFQFQPDLAFKMRILNYEQPGKYHFQATRTRSPNKKGSSFVLPSSTFTHSSVFHPGKQLVFKHSGPVIPTQFQRQNLTPRHR